MLLNIPFNPDGDPFEVLVPSCSYFCRAENIVKQSTTLNRGKVGKVCALAKWSIRPELIPISLAHGSHRFDKLLFKDFSRTFKDFQPIFKESIST